MPKFLAIGNYVEVWQMIVEADSEEEAKAIADENLFEDGLEVDGYLEDLTIKRVKGNFTLCKDTPIAPVEVVEVRAPLEGEEL